MKQSAITILAICAVWILCVTGASSIPLGNWFAPDLGTAISHWQQSTDKMGMVLGGETELSPSSDLISTADGVSIPVRIIDSSGDVSDPINAGDISEVSTVGLEIPSDDGTIIRKIVQTKPQERIITSADGLQIMQVSDSNPILQIRYGYQESADQPFSYFYRVDSENGNCLATLIIFQERSIRSHDITCNAIDSIKAGNIIPEWGDLP